MSIPAPGSESALHVIGWPRPDAPTGVQWRAAHRAHPGTRPARVIEQHRSGYVVAEGPEDGFSVESPPEWLRLTGKRRIDPLARAGVGDWVLLDGQRILTLLPRRSAIVRAAASERYRPQLIAANVDIALIVCGLDADFNPRRIERYLLLVQGEELTPVIVLTKADLSGADVAAARRALAGVIDQGIALVVLNACDVRSVAQLSRWLGAGVTAALIGSSGAGKSTLSNTLAGKMRMKTGEVRIRDARGRHTTTHRALIPLASGACLIDTPGMRALKPTGEESLGEGGFADVEDLAGRCRFHDCRHQAEPGCAVRAAVTAGVLAADRLRHYIKLGEEVAAAASQKTRRK